MNSVSSPGTMSKRRSFHSALACSILSLRRRHEIPPDVARAFHCGSADQNDACLAGGGYCDGVAWPEHQKLTCPEAIAGNIDLARNDIERTLLCVGVNGSVAPSASVASANNVSDSVFTGEC
jgi:hypothetical protein